MRKNHSITLGQYAISLKKQVHIALLLAGMAFLPPAMAADDLEDALSGFDAPAQQSGSELDEALQGFDEQQAFSESSPQIDTEADNWLDFSGNLGFSAHYNTAQAAPAAGQPDYQGVSRLRLSATLVADMTLPKQWKSKLELKTFYDPVYDIKGRADYSQDVLATYESEARINEAWVAGSLSDRLDLKIGRQIEVWGKSDNIRITDVINPLDNRVPGLVDIEDLRLPIFMSKFSYYIDRWAIKLIAISEQRNPLEPGIDSDFLPISVFSLPPNFRFPDVGEGSIDLSQSNLALAIDGRFNGWDVSFYSARVTDSRWHFNQSKSERIYDLVDMSGLAANMVVGGFLLKTEIARLDNLQYNTTSKKKSRIDSLIGVEYMGIHDWVLSAEYANRSILDYEAQMINKVDFVNQNTPQIALRASYSFNNDNATATLLVSLIGDDQGGQQGGFYRLWLDYALNDHVQTSMGYIDYQGGSNPFWDIISNNDRLFFDAKYNF